MVSGVLGSRVTGPCSSLVHAPLYLPLDVTIVPNTLSVEQPLPGLDTGGVPRIPQTEFADFSSTHAGEQRPTEKKGPRVLHFVRAE